MDNVSYSFEAVKYAMNQNKDGHKLSLVIHPNDLPADIINAPIGTRFACAVVIVGDDEKPVVGQEKTRGQKSVQLAGMLCREEEFQKWLGADDEDGARMILLSMLRIKSRSEIQDNARTVDIMFKIADDFRAWKDTRTTGVEKGGWL